MKALTKIISGIVIGGTLLSAGSIAMADTTENPASTDKLKDRPYIAGKMMKGGMKDGIGFKLGHMKVDWKGELDTLVKEGVISQDETDKITALSQKRAEEREAEMEKIKTMTEEERKAYFGNDKSKVFVVKEDIFTDAVKEGILTQEKADAAHDRLQEIHREEMNKEMIEALKSLVENKTITEDQMNKVVEYQNKQAADKETEIEKIKAMTDEERSEYMKNRMLEKKGFLSELVDQGTLTSEQATEVRKALSKGGHPGKGMMRIKGKDAMDKVRKFGQKNLDTAQNSETK